MNNQINARGVAVASSTIIPAQTETATAPKRIPAGYLQEFLDSGISIELAQANSCWLEGPDALEALLADTIASRQKVTSCPTTGNAALLRLYSFIEDGAWFAVDALGSPPYAKPINPRPDPKKAGKVVKYETPPGAQARPLFPSLGAAVAKRWGVSTWEEIFARTDIPVIICEGWKKALALVEQGYPAIAIRGITQWHPQGSRKLWPELTRLAAGGRSMPIAFDQDEKTSTRSDVSRQARLMGNAIERAGSVASFLVWPAEMGKGIDDALVSLPAADRPRWLAQRLQQALTPKDYRRVASLACAADITSKAAPKGDRHTVGEYLPQLPPITPGAVHWNSATMNSGKTYRMGRDWVHPWVESGGVVVVLSPLNSLGQQTAGGKDPETGEVYGFNLPHIHDYYADANSQEALRLDVGQRRGVVGCLNSAHRLAELIPPNAALLLIIDEAAQTLTDAVEGGTLQAEWANRWEDTIALMQRAITGGGAIALAEDGLDSDTIKLAQTLSGATQTIGITHKKESPPWPCTINRATPLSGYRADVLDGLSRGERYLFVTTSQAEGRRLERAAVRRGVKCDRIDSTTNEGGRYREFFEAPEPWLYTHQPQLLILTSSGKTGLSIEGGITSEGAYFDRVCGYFPTLDTDTHQQLLGRYRPPVPRHIWAPAFINPEPGEGPARGSILDLIATTASEYARAGAFEQAPADSYDTAIRQYLAARRTRRWAQKIRAAESLSEALTRAGHDVTMVRTGEGSKAISAEWHEIKEELAQEDASYHAALDVAEVPGPLPQKLAWANAIDRGTDSTHDDRCMAAKIRMMAKFPGIDWGNTDIWYGAVFCPRHEVTGSASSQGPVAKGAALWAEADHYLALWGLDTQQAKTILTKRLKASHLLPQQALNAGLSAVFKPLIAKLLAAGKVTPTGDIEAKIKAKALQFRAQVEQLWRLKISDDQSVTQIANKIARKFGLVLTRLGKVRHAGERLWEYGIEATELWQQLVEARSIALGTNLLEDTLNESVPTPRAGVRRRRKKDRTIALVSAKTDPEKAEYQSSFLTA